MLLACNKNKSVWIISDNKSGWVDKLLGYGFLRACAIGDNGQSGESALAAFDKALQNGAPKYALWSFAKEKGEKHSKNLKAFITKCKEKGIIPVLTTAIEPKTKKKNAEIIASGEKYVDFAALSEFDKVTTSRGYSRTGKDAIAARVIVDFPEIMTPDIEVRKANANLSSTGKLTLGANKVRDGKYFVAYARFDGELKEGQKILAGHGYMESYGKWFEITDKDVNLFSYTSWVKPPLRNRPEPHKITIKNFVTIIISADNDGAGNTLTLITDGGVYRRKGYGWNACQGEIFISGNNVELKDVKAAWTCEDYSAPIWFVGASYFSLGDPARWPYYMYDDGYADKVFITGRGGMNGINGHEEIADAIKFGKPKFMIWGIGMNDGPDGEDDINPATYNNKIGFLKICKEQGIKPLFMTIPNCGNENNQRNDNTYKLDYVINKRGEFANYDYRVVDISHAVNGVEVHSPWYDGMLHSDGTHPTPLGARNFYLELLCTFPELMLGADAEVTEAKADTLSKGESLTVDTGAASEENAITFMADFKDKNLEGEIRVGTEAGYVKITYEKLEVYKTENGKETLVYGEDNKLIMNDIVMLRIHNRGGKASIALVSSGEKDYVPHNNLYKIEADWISSGKVFATADKTDLTKANLKFAKI